jgi:glycosyltransferase involved in cell wall biosynthesis
MTVVVDVQDLALPRETPWTASYAVWWIVDELYYRYSFFIVNAAECERLYGRRAHGRTFLIPMAAHHDIITPGALRPTGSALTLGYVGTISKIRGFPELINVVRDLRAEGFTIDLVVNGNNTESIDLGNYSWLRLCDKQPLDGLADLMRGIDVGVIPYVDRGYWGLVSLTKMALYMAAGLPILSFQLTETSNILDKWECGVSVEDWNGMAAAIRKLYHESARVRMLGMNARVAAIEEYNWAHQATRLGEFLHQVQTWRN